MFGNITYSQYQVNGLSTDINRLSDVLNGGYTLDGNQLKDLILTGKFSQVRLYCRKGTKIFHVITTTNNPNSQSIMDFLSSKTYLCPKPACLFYQKAFGDNSYLSRKCQYLGRQYNGEISYCEKGVSRVKLVNRIYQAFIYQHGISGLNLHAGECDDCACGTNFKAFGSYQFFIR